MEGPSNGGLLYHEVQESKLCAVHCVNTVLQGPFFTELDLAALASDLDQTERQMMAGAEDGGGGGGGGGDGGGEGGGGGGGGIRSEDFLAEDSHNVSVGGDFSIQVASPGNFFKFFPCMAAQAFLVELRNVHRPRRIGRARL